MTTWVHLGQYIDQLFWFFQVIIGTTKVQRCTDSLISGWISEIFRPQKCNQVQLWFSEFPKNYSVYVEIIVKSVYNDLVNFRFLILALFLTRSIEQIRNFIGRNLTEMLINVSVSYTVTFTNTISIWDRCYHKGTALKII